MLSFYLNRRGNATPIVTIDGSPCIIPDANSYNDTEIECETEPHVGSIRTYVRVSVGDDGVAIRVRSIPVTDIFC